ncbi:hypothetical protein DFH09DRAFT_1077423 [Mycena vulgaris]|nr:hypothetical protein DFH09DRAFT_1077423 [Mycena vulgaris]
MGIERRGGLIGRRTCVWLLALTYLTELPPRSSLRLPAQTSSLVDTASTQRRHRAGTSEAQTVPFPRPRPPLTAPLPSQPTPKRRSESAVRCVRGTAGWSGGKQLAARSRRTRGIERESTSSRRAGRSHDSRRAIQGTHPHSPHLMRQLSSCAHAVPTCTTPRSGLAQRAPSRPVRTESTSRRKRSGARGPKSAAVLHTDDRAPLARRPAPPVQRQAARLLDSAKVERAGPLSSCRARGEDAQRIGVCTEFAPDPTPPLPAWKSPRGERAPQVQCISRGARAALRVWRWEREKDASPHACRGFLEIRAGTRDYKEKSELADEARGMHSMVHTSDAALRYLNR